MHTFYHGYYFQWLTNYKFYQKNGGKTDYPPLFISDETIACETFEFFAFSQNNGRPFRMVDTVRKMLGFKAKSASKAAIEPAFSVAVRKEVCGIKLNAGLVGIRNKGYSGNIAGCFCKGMAAYNEG